MKLPIDPRLPLPDDVGQLKQRLTQLLRETATQVNAVSEGRLSGAYNAATAAPTTGTWAQGDFLRNSQPAELGTAGSKYVIFAWQCIAGGTPGTWVQLRYLTGN